MAKKVRPYKYPDLSQGKEDIMPGLAEITAINSIKDLRNTEGGVINNITSIDKLATILEDYLIAKMNG